MDRSGTLKRITLVFAVLALVATGCRESGDSAGGGGGGGDESSPPAASEEAPSEDTASAEPSEEESASEESSGAAGEIEFDTGVTEEPCPEAVNEDNGCIYLGTLSDLSQGPFASLGTAITQAQAAFWEDVNNNGGIGGFDVDVSTYVRDNLYNPETHAQLYNEIKGDVLGLAQTLGSPTTAAIIDDLEADQVVSAPASWTSLWAVEDVIVESGNNYCIESMNSVDYALGENDGIQTVMAIHYPGDYGEDGAAGARIAAEANGLEFIDVPTTPGADNQAGAIDALVSQQPDLVIMTTAPTDMATIVGQAAAQGFQGRVIGNSPTWNPGVLQSPAADAVQALYTQAAPWATYESDTPAHEHMRAALGDVQGNDGFTAGWMWSYPLKAALEQAAENGDLTRSGLLSAVTELENVDYEGALPEGAGNFAGEPNEALVRGTLFHEVDPESTSGLSLITEDFFTGSTAEEFTFEGPCYLEG